MTYHHIPACMCWHYLIMTPLLSPHSLFCTPRRKEGRNISADSVASVTPLLKGKKPSGLFRLSGWGNKNKQNSCLNSKLLRGMMSRKTADNLPQTSVRGTAPPPPPSVSRVRIYNAKSERYEAPLGRHSVQVPSSQPGSDRGSEVSVHNSES